MFSRHQVFPAQYKAQRSLSAHFPVLRYVANAPHQLVEVSPYGSAKGVLRRATLNADSGEYFRSGAIPLFEPEQVPPHPDFCNCSTRRSHGAVCNPVVGGDRA